MKSRFLHMRSTLLRLRGQLVSCAQVRIWLHLARLQRITGRGEQKEKGEERGDINCPPLHRENCSNTPSISFHPGVRRLGTYTTKILQLRIRAVTWLQKCSFISALFITVQHLKHPKHPSVWNWQLIMVFPPEIPGMAQFGLIWFMDLSLNWLL